MYEPRYARLVDAFEVTDIETDEGDIGDDLDNVGDEDEIIALIETNPNCEKRFILLFNSSQRMAKIVFRSKNSTSKPCRRLSRTEWCLVRARSLWPCRGVACCQSSYYVRLVQCQARRRRSCCQPAGKMSYLQINQRKIMKILANKYKLHGENFQQLIFTVVHNNLIIHWHSLIIDI